MNQQNAKIKTAANYGSAMESEDHFENGASLKRQKSKGNIFMRSLAIISILLLSNCVTIAYGQNCESFLQQATELVNQRKYCDAKKYYLQYSNCNANADVSTEMALCERYCKLQEPQGEESTPEPVVENSPDDTSASTDRSSSVHSAQLSVALKNVQRIKFGVSAGVGISNFSSNVDDDDSKSKLGFQIGILGEISITENFFVVPELNFSQRGSSYEWKGYDESEKGSTTLNYLQIPINALYKYKVAENIKVLGFTGPYVGYAISGKDKWEYKYDGEVEKDSKTIKIGSGDEDDAKPLDFGWNFGLGLEYSKLFLKVQYNLGLSNIANTDSGSDYSLKNTHIGISVGYLF
jgi:hypothetical protein